MTLRRRGRRHIAGTDTSLWWDFQPGQRVLTREGFFGVVTAVEDGWVAGNEQYLVELEAGMGGGEYASDELQAANDDDGFDVEAYLAPTIRATRQGNMEQGYATPAPPPDNPFDDMMDSGLEDIPEDDAMMTYASEHYPELTDILVERPPPSINMAAGRKTAKEWVPLENFDSIGAWGDKVKWDSSYWGLGVNAGEVVSRSDDGITVEWYDRSGGNPISTFFNWSENRPFWKWASKVANYTIEGPASCDIRGVHCENCGRLNPETDDGYTECCNELVSWSSSDCRAHHVNSVLRADTPEELIQQMQAMSGVDWDGEMVFMDGGVRGYGKVKARGGQIEIVPFNQASRKARYPKVGSEPEVVEELIDQQLDNDHTHAGLVIKALDTGRVLMTQRTQYFDDDEGVKGQWEFPGGGIQDDEGAVEAALREFQEETGLNLPDGWDLGGSYTDGGYLAVIINVPNEAWTTDAGLLTNETMGIGWFTEEEADILFRADADVDWDTIKEASNEEDSGKRCVWADCPYGGVIFIGQTYGTDDEGRTLHSECRVILNTQGSKTADGWFTDKVLYPMADAFDSALPPQFQYDPEIGTFPADVAGTLGDFAADNPYIGVMVPCTECGSRTRHANAICLKHDDGLGNLLLAIEWEKMNGARTGMMVVANHLEAAWADVQAKAKRIKDAGHVRVISASPAYLVGEVQGDTNIYQSSISYEPGTQRIATWECGCAWAAYSWARSGPWKKYEGRMCSHVQALQWEGQSRGMFNKEVEEDATKPSWMSDPTITVQRPGDYKAAPIGDWRVDAAKEVDTCRECGSSQLFDAYFNEDGDAVTGDGEAGAEWNTVCLDCGKYKKIREATRLRLQGKVAYGNDMSALNVDQLKALLQMAQAEGQTEVERWVRDALQGRGVYSRMGRVSMVRQSGMNPNDWLAKAMSLILAGGIMFGGVGALPVVDQSVQQPPAVVQISYGEVQGVMPDGLTQSQVQGWIDSMRQIARQVPGANPSAPITVHFVESSSQLPSQCPSETGCASANGDIYVAPGISVLGTTRTVIHEIAHGLSGTDLTQMGGPNRDGHGDIWCEVFDISGAQLAPGLMGVCDSGKHGMVAELKDEPEPALPMTTADEDVDDDLDPSLAWIMEDNQGGDMDIAAAAKAYLKTGTIQKDARAFSVAEQQELINEGEGELARNFSSLDIRGTHYEYLDDEESDDEYLW